MIEKFQALCAQSPEAATDWYYKFSQDINYIRRDRIAKDVKWKSPTEYGDLDVTINLSKPEKDPKAIAAARNLPASAYPRCQLCAENEGYTGRINHPARLKEELAAVADCLVSGSDLRASELTAKHADWAEGFTPNYTFTKENALDIVEKETGLVFAQVLEHAGVYKRSSV